METGRIHGQPLIHALAAWLAVEGGAFLLFGENGFSLKVIAGMRILEIAAWLAIFRLHYGNLKPIGLDPSRWRRGLIRGSLWAGGFGGLALLAAVFIHLAGHDPVALIRAPVPVSAGGVAALILAGGLIGPVAEEIFFRGVLQGYFRRRGAPIAILLSTVLFAAAHYPHVSPVQVIGGFLFAVAYEIEQDLTVPVVVHTTGNTAIFLVSFYF